MKPALVPIQHVLGLPGTTENNIIFFPKQYGGFATEDLHLEMLAQQVRYFIQHVRNGDSVGKQIQIIMSVYQLEPGLDEPIEGKEPKEVEGYLTDPLPLTLLKEPRKRE